MPGGFKILGSDGLKNAIVDANFSLQATGPLDNTDKAGFQAIVSEIDPGNNIGARKTKALESSDDYRLRIGTDSPVFDELFTGTALNTAKWFQGVGTMTIGVTAGFCILNNASSVASVANARIYSYQFFPLYKSFPLYFNADLIIVQLPQTNNVCEWGFAISTSGTANPTDGAFFRINSSGELRGVISYAGTEVPSSVINFASIVGAGNIRNYVVAWGDKSVKFWISDSLVAEIPLPAAAAAITSSQSLQVYFRNYNSNVTAVAQVMKIAHVTVSYGDMVSNKPWADMRSLNGGHGSQGQTTRTMGSTALYTLNLAIGAGAVWTGTTAALGSGLGGQFTLQPNTLAINSDGIIQSFQNPAASNIAPGRNLVIKGIRFVSMVTAAHTGGPAVVIYALQYGHTAVSLATVEGSGSKAPRAIPLGIEVFPAAAAKNTFGSIGALGIYIPFNAPITVYPGEFVQFTGKNIDTLVTAGTITYLIMYDCYWD